MQVTGAPALFEGRLYVPISGGDDSAAVDPKYECCKGRGAVVALDAANGSVIWKNLHSFGEPPARQERGRNPALWPFGRFRLFHSDQRCRPCFIARFWRDRVVAP